MIGDAVRDTLLTSSEGDAVEAISCLVMRHGPQPLLEELTRMGSLLEPSMRPFRRGKINAARLPPPGDVERMWFGLYPGALVYLIGQTGCGKSTYLYNVAVHAARNVALWNIPFGGRRPLRVGYADPENCGNWSEGRGGLCAAKLDRIREGKPPNLWFFDCQDVNLSRPVDLADMEEAIRDDHLDVLILDPIINLYETKDENDNAEAGRQMKALKAIAHRTNCCIVAVHHTGKEDSGGFGRGASARLGVADVGVVMRVRAVTEDVDDEFQGELRQREGYVRVQIVKNRIEPGYASLFFRMAGEDMFERANFQTWRAAPSDEHARMTKRERAKVELRLLLGDGEYHTRRQLMEEIYRTEEISQVTVTQAINELLRSGQIDEAFIGNDSAVRLHRRQDDDDYGENENAIMEVEGNGTLVFR